jgi:hypothetical protein
MAARLEYADGEFGNAEFPFKVISIKANIRLTIDLAFYETQLFCEINFSQFEALCLRTRGSIISQNSL